MHNCFLLCTNKQTTMLNTGIFKTFGSTTPLHIGKSRLVEKLCYFEKACLATSVAKSDTHAF